IRERVIEGANGSAAPHPDLEWRLLVEEIVDRQLHADIAKIFVRRHFSGLVAESQIEIDGCRREVREICERSVIRRTGKARARPEPGLIKAVRQESIA